MYQIRSSACFDSAHFLKGYEGKCSQIHGHRWTIEVCVEREEVEDQGQTRGMVVDFRQLKDDLKDLVDSMDHSLIVEEESLKDQTLKALKDEEFKVIQVPFRPTAEGFAKYFFDCVAGIGYEVAYVDVYETPNNVARYYE